MSIYQRMMMVNAIQFNVDEFHEDQLKFPMIFDKAMFSATWMNKTAKDGRYYLINQGTTDNDVMTMHVNDGDYIIVDEGWHIVYPKEIFERSYEMLQK